MLAITTRYLGQVPRSDGSRVLEIGCGNGAATAHIVEHLEPGELVGVDPAQGFIDIASARYAGRSEVRFTVGDAIATGQPDAYFDLVLAHTVFSHLPDPVAALQEAMRVLRPGGRLVIFDGDYATNTVALFDGDPLQTAMQTVLRNLVHDPYVMRRLSSMAESAGFETEQMEGHGYLQVKSPDYLLTLLSRGLSAGASAGELSTDLADGFMQEAQSRVDAGTFYGAILFVSLMVRKPG